MYNPLEIFGGNDLEGGLNPLPKECQRSISLKEFGVQQVGRENFLGDILGSQGTHKRSLNGTRKVGFSSESKLNTSQINSTNHNVMPKIGCNDGLADVFKRCFGVPKRGITGEGGPIRGFTGCTFPDSQIPSHLQQDKCGQFSLYDRHNFGPALNRGSSDTRGGIQLPMQESTNSPVETPRQRRRRNPTSSSESFGYFPVERNAQCLNYGTYVPPLIHPQQYPYSTQRYRKSPSPPTQHQGIWEDMGAPSSRDTQRWDTGGEFSRSMDVNRVKNLGNGGLVGDWGQFGGFIEPHGVLEPSNAGGINLTAEPAWSMDLSGLGSYSGGVKGGRNQFLDQESRIPEVG
jgi:hypothetical protein